MKFDDKQYPHSRQPTNKPYAMVGAGELSAAIWKHGDERAGWRYWFNLFRLSGRNGRVSQQFSPSDVRQLVKLCRVLAMALLDDGCLSAADREDLNALTSSLAPPTTLRVLLPSKQTPSEVIAAIERLIARAWDQEHLDFLSHPETEHPFHDLQLLQQWLRQS